MLTSIRNAQAVKKEAVSVPYSKIKMEIVNILVQEKFIKEADHKGKKTKKTIDMILNYGENGDPAIKNIKRISKPSQRIYVASNKIKPVRNGFGIKILTTPKGVMTDKSARKEKVGGEILCEVW